MNCGNLEFTNDWTSESITISKLNHHANCINASWPVGRKTMIQANIWLQTRSRCYGPLDLDCLKANWLKRWEPLGSP